MSCSSPTGDMMIMMKNAFKPVRLTVRLYRGLFLDRPAGILGDQDWAGLLGSLVGLASVCRLSEEKEELKSLRSRKQTILQNFLTSWKDHKSHRPLPSCKRTEARFAGRRITVRFEVPGIDKKANLSFSAQVGRDWRHVLRKGVDGMFLLKARRRFLRS